MFGLDFFAAHKVSRRLWASAIGVAEEWDTDHTFCVFGWRPRCTVLVGDEAFGPFGRI